MRRLAALGVILVYFLLAGSYHLWAQRQFNARMNEDIESFLSRFENAKADGERLQALRSALLQTKQNTTSYVSSTFMALFIAGGFLYINLWGLVARDKGSGG